MLVAEDVAAVSAVMPALEEAEGFVADWVVADRGVGVGFPVFARGWAGDGGEVFVFLGYGLLVFCPGTRLMCFAVCGRAPAHRSTSCFSIDKAVGTAVDAARWCEG